MYSVTDYVPYSDSVQAIMCYTILYFLAKQNYGYFCSGVMNALCMGDKDQIFCNPTHTHTHTHKHLIVLLLSLTLIT